MPLSELFESAYVMAALPIRALLQVDKVNRQVAARMIGPFSQWKQFNEPRQKLMKEQLGRIMAAKDLSENVYEIAAKSLE